jgi:hypothetical protein
MPITLNGDTGITAPTYAGTVAAEYSVPVTAFKNRIINGAMGIWQRGTSFTLSSGVPTYTTDRFAAFPSAASCVASQSTDVPAGQGFRFSYKMQRPSTFTSTNNQWVTQIIESNNMLDLAGQTVTLTFWAKAGANYSATSNGLNVTISTGTVADQGVTALFNGTWTGIASPVATAVSLTTSWQKFTVSGTIASSALELAVLFSETPTGTAGADDSFFITGVQLEKGSNATSFDYRPYGTELALCQRYYLDTTAAFSSFYNGNGSTVSYSCNISFPTTMRAAPTVTFSNISATLTNGDAADFISVNGFAYRVNMTATGVASRYSAARCTSEL